MEIGTSSSCFYPLETEKAFLNVAEMGFKTSEIFFNSRSELKDEFVNELKKIKDSYEIDVVSLHPYRSFSEGYDFFTSYKRRFVDAMERYKRLFAAAEKLSAKYIVMHGSKNMIDITMEEYAERFHIINEEAKAFGCSVVHENVVQCVGAYSEFMFFMKKLLGDEFKMVLDIKQARRAKVNIMEFIDTMGENIVHAHLSDFTHEKDCTLPSKDGLFDFENFFKIMEKNGFKGKYIVEVYSNAFESREEILDSALYLDEILKRSRK